MIISIANTSNFVFFSANFLCFFSGFRAKFQKIVTCVASSINLRKQIRNLPKILNFVKLIHYHSKLFTGVLSHLPFRSGVDGSAAGAARQEGRPRGRPAGSTRSEPPAQHRRTPHAASRAAER